jgi:hypothetical protein
LRRAALWLLGGLAIWLIGVGTLSVLSQSLWRPLEATHHDCRAGAQALLQALETARNHATDHTLNEREALRAFRTDLRPTWGQAHAIVRRCELARDKVALRAIHSLELLRYAEERSIRLNAVELTHLRRTTPRLVKALSIPTP